MGETKFIEKGLLAIGTHEEPIFGLGQSTKEGQERTVMEMLPKPAHKAMTTVTSHDEEAAAPTASAKADIIGAAPVEDMGTQPEVESELRHSIATQGSVA
uniref:Uncharacterized protein n=1 Tax=Nelumbo nucifera TaxID=4432 RepID=A0A822XUI3_NELNU|nr:TPA_asm: hypothetical protein HUJ06_025493 [Nelumbo nucifera]